jgi:hypothetical protein
MPAAGYELKKKRSRMGKGINSRELDPLAGARKLVTGGRRAGTDARRRRAEAEAEARRRWPAGGERGMRRHRAGMRRWAVSRR